MGVGEILNPDKIPGIDKTLALVCGIIDFFLFGIGTMIVGIVANDMMQVVIGILQLVIPFVGWLWSIIWGIFIIKKAYF